MIVRNIILLVMVVAMLFSCTKKNGAPVNTKPGSFSQAFDQFWEKMNSRYLFWDIDTTNWEAVRLKYAPVFASMDLNNRDDLKRSVRYFREMTAGLTDGHYYITFTNTVLKDSVIYPSRDRKRKEPGYHEYYNYSGIVHKYLDVDLVTGNDNISRPISAISGTIGRKVIYFSCSNFYLSDSWHAARPNSIKPVLQNFFALLEHPPTDCKGIVLDLRGNGGGDISDLGFIISKLSANPVNFGFTKYKSGSGRLDYTPWVPSTITPAAGSKGTALPVIVLTDNYSASLAESFALVISRLPKGLVVGETTWGANGPYTHNESIYNAGPFKVEGVMDVQTSSAAFKALDGNSYEGKGIPPAIAIPFDGAALQSGKDPVLEAALKELKL